MRRGAFTSASTVNKMMRGGQKQQKKNGYWAFVCQLDHWGLWKWGVKRTILHRCPQGSSVPNRFSKNKSPLPSDSSSSFWFTSPLADTSLNVIGQLKVMKCNAVLWNCGWACYTCDWEININVQRSTGSWHPVFPQLTRCFVHYVAACWPCMELLNMYLTTLKWIRLALHRLGFFFQVCANAVILRDVGHSFLLVSPSSLGVEHKHARDP